MERNWISDLKTLTWRQRMTILSFTVLTALGFAAVALSYVLPSEYCLIILAGAISAFGALWPAPPLIVRAALVVFAVFVACISLNKAREDNRDKEFLQRAVTSTLIPAHSEYEGFYDDVRKPVEDAQRDFNKALCQHSDIGMVCFFPPSPPNFKSGTIVLEKAELAQMYAHRLHDKSGSRKKNEAIVAQNLAEKFDVATPTEGLLSKAGIVGFLAFTDKCFKFPKTYYYDKRWGVKVVTDTGEIAHLTIAELNALKSKDSLDLFQEVQELFRQKFASPPFKC